jgi:flagellin
MVQVAEGGLGEISNILTRMRELGVQASSDTVGDVERTFIDKEVQQLKLEAERISQTTRFGKTTMLNGEGPRFEFQVDINNDDTNDRIGFEPSEIKATTAELGIASFNFGDKHDARAALEVLENSQRTVNGYRATLGAIQNRLVSTTDNLGVSIENFSAANSRIRDTDIAQSSSELSRNTILQNASISVLAQANQQPMSALKLTQIGNSVGVIFPKELLARLKLEKGDSLFVSEAANGVMLTPYDPEVEKQIALGREFMHDFRDTFNQLAK